MPKQDAIEKDVSQEEQNQVVADALKNANDERLNAVNELAQRSRERRNADLEEAGHEVIDTSGKEDQETEQKTEQKAEEDHEEETLQEKPEQEEEETRVLKVDGKEVEVPLSKILEAGTRAVQKESAADARLQEATELLKEAQKQNQLSQDVGHEEESTLPSIDAENLAKTLIDGDLDDVKEAVEKIIGVGRVQDTTKLQGLDRNEVFSYVQDALSVDKALALFQEDPEKGGFGDLYADEKLREMVMDAEKKLADDGDTRDYSVRLADAANGVREWRDSIAAGGDKVKGFDSVKDKKAKADNTIESAGGRDKPKGESKPKTRGEVRKSALESMAKSRGQQLD